MTAVAAAPTTPLERYVDAIARRNITWTRLAEARELLDWAPSSDAIRQVNVAQDEYEHAARELGRARFALRQDEAGLRCHARIGYARGDFGEVAVRCEVRLGLTVYTDRHGERRAYCAGHREYVQGRWPAVERVAVTA